VTGRSSEEAAWLAGYERGTQSGHAIGYREGATVLDDASSALAELRPTRVLDMVAARERLAAGGPSLTPAQIRAQAAASWGLPAPADLASTVEPAGVAEPPAADEPVAVQEELALDLADEYGCHP
jgi:hypothetical protein